MLQKIDPRSLAENPFSLIGDDWMLVTAGTAEACNTMTASWGGVGILWNYPVATIYVRPQRYTKVFLDAQDTFSLSFFGRERRRELALCGSKSGRDINKFEACGFTVETAENGAPYIGEAKLVFCCRKLYWQDMEPAHFLDAEIEKHYPEEDYHRIYIGKIEEAYAK